MTRRSRLAFVLGPCLLGLCGVARPATAAAPQRLWLGTNSDCPSASDTAAELHALLPHTRVDVTSSETPEDAERASIEDEGETVRVRVQGQERLFRDPVRACRERQRTAAVFIALVLDPPLLPEAEPPAAPAPKPAPPVLVPEPARFPPAAASPRAPYTLELAPLLEVAPISDAKQLPLAGGFGARLARGKSWGISFGAALLLPTRLTLPVATARLVWLPFDVSLRATHTLGSLVFAGDLGPELALLFASGDRVNNPRTSTRLEPGLRAAASFTWGMSQHLGAFVTLFGVVRPKPYHFALNPDQPSGSTPPLWLGASLGLSLRGL